MKTEMKRTSVIVGLVLISAYACSNRPESGTVGTSGTTATADRESSMDVAIADSDRDFVRDLAMANIAEVDLANLARDRSENPAVKKFAQMMIDDHSKAESQLQAVAAAHGIAVPSVIDDTHRTLHDQLAALQGSAFDREYARTMVDGHESVLGKLESRIDGAVLADWKAKFGDALKGGAETRQPGAVTPEASDNPVTRALNQWAADAYSTVFSHTESAKVLKSTVKG